ncbi:SDR family NAD(P)-dependent oxidoreductase [Agrobacterium larrymoorei]|uniref:SDR family NAD(P)-dependent oxidoreductase n=1 Tax=Agrobacterium larrymoorei TaxID=160699 RepID=A0AAF0HC85_9HYPH|nr:SDR family NAD(P)-dependent oxidoreductase [Agrobacterium larrymoorei]WHA43816.1 SDR family NAD(P)-dependent oxidoreductase [Agrobacterium larrymoorei]
MTSLPDGFRALVIGASGGIGSAVVKVLEEDARCSKVTGLSRSGTGLDVTDEDSVAAAAAGVDGECHLLFCATGALTINGVGPEKALKQLSPGAMMRQFALNALGPALVLKHFAPKLARKERSLSAFLSARVGSIGDNHLGGWISYRSSKAALNQITRTAAIELARTHPQSVVAALHPGTVATGLTEDYSAGRERLQPETSARMMLDVLDGLQPGQTGEFFAYDGERVEW